MNITLANEAHQAQLEHLRTARSRRDEIEGNYEELEKADSFIEQLEADERRAWIEVEAAFAHHEMRNL